MLGATYTYLKQQLLTHHIMSAGRPNAGDAQWQPAGHSRPPWHAPAQWYHCLPSMHLYAYHVYIRMYASYDVVMTGQLISRRNMATMVELMALVPLLGAAWT